MMPVGRFRLLFLVPLLLTVHTCGCAANHAARSLAQPAMAQKLHVPGISDFGKVNDFLYRGTQPNDEGVERLSKLGIDTIINLRGERPGTMEKERKHAESLGMRFVNIPGDGWTPPGDEQVAEFFLFIREKPKRRIFVHCWLGGDRSGVFIAAYRIAFEGWTPEQVLAEMRSFHFKGFWHPAMKSYIRDFPTRLARSPVLIPFQQRASAKKE